MSTKTEKRREALSAAICTHVYVGSPTTLSSPRCAETVEQRPCPVLAAPCQASAGARKSATEGATATEGMAAIEDVAATEGAAVPEGATATEDATATEGATAMLAAPGVEAQVALTKSR